VKTSIVLVITPDSSTALLITLSATPTTCLCT